MLPDAPSVTYQEEAFDVVWPEVQPLLKMHWEEIAQDKATMPLDVAVEAYRQLDAEGGLSLVTVRVDEELVGYFVSFVRPHLHYQSTLCAYVDLYYVAPAYREGLFALELFKQAEACLRARGVQKVFAGTKTYKHVGALFRRLHWRETETLYTKWLGE